MNYVAECEDYSQEVLDCLPTIKFCDETDVNQVTTSPSSSLFNEPESLLVDEPNPHLFICEHCSKSYIDRDRGVYLSWLASLIFRAIPCQLFPGGATA